MRLIIAALAVALFSATAMGAERTVEFNVPSNEPIMIRVIDSRLDGEFWIDREAAVHGTLSPKDAAAYFSRSDFYKDKPGECRKLTYIVYFEMNDIERHKSWSIGVDPSGRVNYTGLDYVSPRLAEFFNALGEELKCA